MPNLLYIEASPRGADSTSSQAADIFLKALPADANVDHLPLFESDLPEFGATLAAAKYQTMFGQTLTDELASAWEKVLHLVEQFKAADHYLLSVPMWNFGSPYKLKQYIDLITHPGLTFAPGPEGMQGLTSGAATVVFSRGGDYSPKNGEPDPYDYQSPYLLAWLSMVGINDVEQFLIQQTMAGPDAAADAIAAVSGELRSRAADVRTAVAG